MLAYPLVVLLVSVSFCAVVLQQYGQRHRPYQLAWAISLASAAAGSLSYIVFLAGDKAALAFRLYYIFGALITAPMLGLGSLLLMARSERAQRWVRVTLAVVLGGIGLGVVLLLVNPLDPTLLRALNGGPGSNPDIYTAGPWKAVVAILNIFGALAVVGVALYSGWQLWRRHGSGQLMAANVLIALGAYVISQAGSQARLGFGVGIFWLTMAIGWVVLFVGFLLTFNVQRSPAASPVRKASAAARS